MAEADNSLVARLRKALGSSYTIEGEIGRGGMGVVYQARDERLKRQVAIKVLPPELAFREEIRIRFLREAETAARLSHPHIVPIHSVGEGPDGLVYFVMAYVDGESVAAKLKRRRSEEHTSELQSQSNLVCRLLLEKKNQATWHVSARRRGRSRRSR